jgi:PAS domain S-box-containing protein
MTEVVRRLVARRGRAVKADAENALRVLEAVIEGTTDDVFVKDLDGRFIVVNGKAAQTIGRRREELIGHTLHELVAQPIADMMAETDRQVLERGTVETFEEIVDVDGRQRVLLTTKGPYRSSDGTLLGTFGIARDITARKAQEEELVRSHERFQIAQGGARMGIWDLDLVTGTTAWTDGLRSVYGVGAEFPTGFDGFEQLLHPDDRARVASEFHEASAVGSDFEFECRIIRPDGVLRWILARSTTVRGEDEAPIRQLGVVVDITERKLAVEGLVRSEETLRLAQLAAGLGSWDWNLTSGKLRWTEGVFEIFGLDSQKHEPSYELMLDHIHPDDRSAVHREFRELFASAETYYESPCRVVQPSGQIRWVLNRGTVLRGLDGSALRVLGVSLDDTARQRAEVERGQLEVRLRQAEKLEALGQLAGGVAHDFNNLLLAIRGYGELALGRLERGEDGAAGDLAGVLESADRAGALTRQLLAFGRRQVLNPEPLDLNEVVRGTIGLLQQLIGDSVEVRAVTPDQALVVKADRGQLEQVLTNLAVNARDAMPGGGLLTIHVAAGNLTPSYGAPPRYAVMSVTDEGSGIDAATAALIFEPFFTTKGEEGTGLGLATVYGIVAQSGGQVVLDTAPGRGSTFTVYLPLSTEALPVQRMATPTVVMRGSETILLVEDDPAVREIVTTMLSNRGYAIIGAADGDEAIAQFEARRAPIQLVISDLIMRGLDGRQTTDRIRLLEPSTKVLYMSGYTYDGTIRSGELATGTGFIQKPFSGDALATRVRELLDHTAA